ncbi:DNA-binding NarL/FixJ family response regulator [Saccharothrix ecbatanensis]|jgi:DNA-binding NarL/FixJ family response regulator|uniref:DNA-binding NarL/FixJ family response regulator n=1 Tax=Saccharothrix ecbatanensis TaxID=1105145 RepID=A0A7W9HLY8_9PSEU|nr:response regulator transcription factor [Saccharothrix ecbatanensis]MBB5804727.1 DNA-binding NarL/FixJ family response regulator [Saccharothrix ecbatanensis]
MAALRALVVDDHPLFRYGLAAALAAAPDLEVVGEASGGGMAVSMAASLHPDVVVMDLNMPDLGGVEATRRIVAHDPSVRVLVLTMFDDDESVFAAMRAGALGYLLKAARPQQIVRAVRSVGEGEAIFSPAIAVRLLAFFGSAPPERVEAFPELTVRERDVLRLMADGRGNAAIARSLVLSPKTVRNHVSNILRKLHVADRAQAVSRAKQAGLGEAPGHIGTHRP